jgi:3-oxoacyl-[acyl-carrier-protein] synthase-3
MDEVFITALGKIPARPAIGNDEMEDYLGRINGQPSRARARAVSSGTGFATNQVRAAYALDKQQRTTVRGQQPDRRGGR